MFSLQIFLYFALEINIKLKRYKEDNIKLRKKIKELKQIIKEGKDGNN